MRKVILCILATAGCVCMSAVVSAEPARAIEFMDGENRTSAMRAFLNGDFAQYKRYLEAVLAWHLKRMEKLPFDKKTIGDEILRYSVQNRIELTQNEFDKKVEEAQKLVQGFGGGWQQVHREQVRQLYESLALLCSIMSDHACELKNRKSASEYE